MKYLELILFKAWADIRSEASRAYIGFLWWFIEPILYMGTFYLLFGLGLRYGGEGFVYFLLVGLVPWKWFSSTVSNGSRSIEAHAGLIQQVYLPKYVLPISAAVTNTIKFLIILPLLILLLAVAGFEINTSWFGLVLLVLLQFLFTAATATLLAALLPYVPDLRYLIENGLLLLMFLSGVFFNVADFSQAISEILLLNPVAVLLFAYREVLLNGSWPSINDLLYLAIWSAVVVSLAAVVIQRVDRHIAKVL